MTDMISDCCGAGWGNGYFLYYPERKPYPLVKVVLDHIICMECHKPCQPVNEPVKGGEDG